MSPRQARAQSCGALHELRRGPQRNASPRNLKRGRSKAKILTRLQKKTCAACKPDSVIAHEARRFVIYLAPSVAGGVCAAYPPCRPPEEAHCAGRATPLCGNMVYLAFQPARFVPQRCCQRCACALTARFHPYRLAKSRRLFSVTLSVAVTASPHPLGGAVPCVVRTFLPHRALCATKGDKAAAQAFLQVIPDQTTARSSSNSCPLSLAFFSKKSRKRGQETGRWPGSYFFVCMRAPCLLLFALALCPRPFFSEKRYGQGSGAEQERAQRKGHATPILAPQSVRNGSGNVRATWPTRRNSDPATFRWLCTPFPH